MSVQFSQTMAKIAPCPRGAIVRAKILQQEQALTDSYYIRGRGAGGADRPEHFRLDWRGAADFCDDGLAIGQVEAKDFGQIAAVQTRCFGDLYAKKGGCLFRQ